MTHPPRWGQDGPTADDPADGPTGPARAPEAEPRCPSCGALRPPAVTWCTQCYARFDGPDGAGRDSGARDGAPDGAGSVRTDAAEQVGAPEPDLGPSAPRRAGAAPVAPEEVEARAQELLARLAGERTGDERVRSWSGLVQGNGQKVVAMVVGTIVLTGLLFGAMAVFGALL